MKKILMMVLMLGAVGWSYGQGKLTFDETIHDFGVINEVDGPVTHIFRLFNSGDKPMQITDVNASCGCTTPGWTTETIMPGDSGYVTARYNPLNRPGDFKKSLSVTSTAENRNVVVYIEGRVKPKPRTIEDELPTKIGGMRIRYRSLNLGKVTTEQPVEKVFEVYNDSDSAWSFLPDKTGRPAHLTVSFEPDTLQPKEMGAISITYDPAVKDQLGFSSDNIELYTTEKSDSVKRLLVLATVEEYFPPMTEAELEMAPRLTFDRGSHDFDEVNRGNVVETTFTITNIGKSDLNIRTIRTNCSCTVARLEKETLKPGESAGMSVSFDTAGRRGRQYKTVTVFSNDPTAPSQMISIRAEVEE